MKKARLSPDGYIQMALQLAYYKLHKETPKTYEPATSRSDPFMNYNSQTATNNLQSQTKEWIIIILSN